MKRQTAAKWIKDVLPKKCMNCGQTSNLTYHHIVPVVCGGNDVPSNYAVLCGRCHDAIHYRNNGTLSHSELAKAGIKRAKANGVRLGRKPASYEHVMQMIAQYSTQFNDIYDLNYEMKTEHEIAQMSGVKYTTYAKCKKMLVQDMKSGTWNHSFKKPKQCRGMPLYEHVILRLRSNNV